MSKQKFDLSNVGGQPKDWAQRSQENDLDSRLGFKDWGMLLLLGVSGLTFFAGLGYLILRILR